MVIENCYWFLTDEQLKVRGCTLNHICKPWRRAKTEGNPNAKVKTLLINVIIVLIMF